MAVPALMAAMCWWGDLDDNDSNVTTVPKYDTSQITAMASIDSQGNILPGSMEQILVAPFLAVLVLLVYRLNKQ